MRKAWRKRVIIGLRFGTNALVVLKLTLYQLLSRNLQITLISQDFSLLIFSRSAELCLLFFKSHFKLVFHQAYVFSCHILKRRYIPLEFNLKEVKFEIGSNQKKDFQKVIYELILDFH